MEKIFRDKHIPRIMSVIGQLKFLRKSIAR